MRLGYEEMVCTMEANVTERKRCNSLRKDGMPCQSPAISERGYCFMHDPTLTQKRDEARRRGGANSCRTARLNKLIPSQLRPIYGLLQRALVECYQGRLDYRRANAVASVARALVSVLISGELETVSEA